MSWCATCMDDLTEENQDPNLMIMIGSSSNRKTHRVCHRCAAIIRKQKDTKEAIECIRCNLNIMEKPKEHENNSKEASVDHSEQLPFL